MWILAGINTKDILLSVHNYTNPLYAEIIYIQDGMYE